MYDLDNGSGELAQQAGEHLATLLQPSNVRRQLKKLGVGMDAITSDVSPALGSDLAAQGSNLENDVRYDSIVLGQQTAYEEALTLAETTNALSGNLKSRQLNQLGVGTAAITHDFDPALASDIVAQGNNLENDIRYDSILTGQQTAYEEALSLGELSNAFSTNLQRRQAGRTTAGAAALTNDVDPALAQDVYVQGTTLNNDAAYDSNILDQQTGYEEALTAAELAKSTPTNFRLLERRQTTKAGAGSAAIVNDFDRTLGNDVLAQSTNLDNDVSYDSVLFGQQTGYEEAITGQETGNLLNNDATLL